MIIKRTKVCFVIPSLSGGGAERIVVNLLNQLDTTRIDLSVLLFDEAGAHNLRDDIEVRVLGSKRVIYSVMPFKRFLRRHHPDVVISNLTHVNLLTIFSNMLAGRPARVIVVEHNTWSNVKWTEPWIKRNIMQWLMKRFYKLCEVVVCVSRGVANDLRDTLSLSEEQLHVIYNPVVGGHVQDQAKAPVTHPWFLNKRCPIVMTAGRLVPAKDHRTLLNAFSIVLTRVPARLVILGTGPLLGDLEHHAQELDISDSVLFHGFDNNPYKFMQSSDLFVLSSVVEGLPTVLIEALACGTRVVATDCPSGPREILKDGALGTLVPPGQAHVLADAILNSLTSKDSGESERRTRGREFSTEKGAQAYYELIERIVERAY